MNAQPVVKVAVVYAGLDMSEVVRSKLDFDVTDRCARPDVFQFAVNEGA